jgi:hypothetical protein
VRNPTKFSTKALSIPGFEALFNKNGAAAKLSFCNSPILVGAGRFEGLGRSHSPPMLAKNVGKLSLL